jgi:hypothetical protein
MFKFRKRPKIKPTEELEILEINLIKDLPLEYAYLIKGSNRVIQKRNRQELALVVKEYPRSTEYVKMGPNKPYELVESIPELKDIVVQEKRKTDKKTFIQSLILLTAYFAVTVVFMLVKDDFEEGFVGVFFLLGSRVLIYTGRLVYDLLKRKTII